MPTFTFTSQRFKLRSFFLLKTQLNYATDLIVFSVNAIGVFEPANLIGIFFYLHNARKKKKRKGTAFFYETHPKIELFLDIFTKYSHVHKSFLC